MTRRNGKVTPMTRLIERQEFEKRLADYTANVLKSFQHILGLIASQQAEIEALKTEVEALKAPKPTFWTRIAPVLLLFVMGCDVTITTRAVCRGDTTEALQDTSLVKCSTLDSLAKGER